MWKIGTRDLNTQQAGNLVCQFDYYWYPSENTIFSVQCHNLKPSVVFQLHLITGKSACDLIHATYLKILIFESFDKPIKMTIYDWNDTQNRSCRNAKPCNTSAHLQSSVYFRSEIQWRAWQFSTERRAINYNRK